MKPPYVIRSTDQADRERVGEFVRRSLARRLEGDRCTWPLEVEWDDPHIAAWLVRGELVLRTWERRQPWWAPATKERAMDISAGFVRILTAEHKKFADAGETGRRVVTLWGLRGGGIVQTEQPRAEPLQVQLERGVYLGSNAATRRLAGLPISGRRGSCVEAGGGVGVDPSGARWAKE